MLKMPWLRSVDQFAEIVHHEIRPVAPELLGIALARDANDEAEISVRSGLYARNGVLDDDRPRGRDRRPRP